MANLTSAVHTQPVNVAGYLAALVAGIVTLAADPALHGFLSSLPQTPTIQAVAGVLAAIGAAAAAYRNATHAAQSVAADQAASAPKP